MRKKDNTFPPFHPFPFIIESSYTHHNFTIHTTSPTAVPCLTREHVRPSLTLYHRHFITSRSPHNHSHRHHTQAHHARTAAPHYLSLYTISLHCCINLPCGWCSGMDTARLPASLSLPLLFGWKKVGICYYFILSPWGKKIFVNEWKEKWNW